MENTNIINAMANYINENGINHEKIVNSNGMSWMTTAEWADVLGMTISTSRMTSMYKAGLVLRVKDKAYFGDNVYHYWPVNLKVTAW